MTGRVAIPWRIFEKNAKVSGPNKVIFLANCSENGKNGAFLDKILLFCIFLKKALEYVYRPFRSLTEFHSISISRQSKYIYYIINTVGAASQ